MKQALRTTVRTLVNTAVAVLIWSAVAAFLVGVCGVRGNAAPAYDHLLNPVTGAFMDCANKALAGDFGPLQEWQRRGYQIGLEAGTLQKTAWVTTYYPQEGFTTKSRTASGYPCSLRVCAANLEDQYTFVWFPNPCHLRQVLDTGAHFNDRIARAPKGTPVHVSYRGREWTAYGKGADLWLDLWVPRPGWRGVDTMTVDVLVIRR